MSMTTTMNTMTTRSASRTAHVPHANVTSTLNGNNGAERASRHAGGCHACPPVADCGHAPLLAYREEVTYRARGTPLRHDRSLPLHALQGHRHGRYGHRGRHAQLFQAICGASAKHALEVLLLRLRGHGHGRDRGRGHVRGPGHVRVRLLHLLCDHHGGQGYHGERAVLLGIVQRPDCRQSVHHP